MSLLRDGRNRRLLAAALLLGGAVLATIGIVDLTIVREREVGSISAQQQDLQSSIDEFRDSTKGKNVSERDKRLVDFMERSSQSMPGTLDTYARLVGTVEIGVGTILVIAGLIVMFRRTRVVDTKSPSP